MARVVFFGSSKFVIPILEVLQGKFDLVLVLTTEKLPTDPVISYCTKHRVHYYVAIDFRNKRELRKLKQAKAEIGIVASFGALIPNPILNLFPKGILNIHPSLLPKYRGPTPVQAAIFNGDRKTGVSIIKLDEQMDHGLILAQVEEKIFPNDTAEILYKRLFKIGAELLNKNIERYLSGYINEMKQDHKKATYTKQLTRKDGYFDIDNPPSIQKLDRMIRAYHPWPSVWTRQIINNKSSIIKFLPQQKIQVEGGKPMSYKDFLNGYPNAKGMIEKLI